MKGGFIRGVASLEGNNLEAVSYSSTSEIWPDKKGGLWWGWPHKRGTTAHLFFRATYF